MELTRDAKDKHNKYQREWRKRNPEKFRAIRKRSKAKRKDKDLDYSRHTRLGTWKNGKQVHFYRLKKRPYPNNKKCYLCQEFTKLLSYHHWDDNDLKNGAEVKGLWVCWKCHTIITLLENYPNVLDMYKKYIKYKEDYVKTK